MEISDEFTGDICVVSARGRLDGNSSEQFGGRLEALIAPDQSKLLVDFSGINFVTSAGLRAVILVLKKVKAANGVFALCAVQAPVREVLEITGFTSMLQIYPDRAGAISALSQNG
jgi:anti-anti-sigma factor